MAGKIRLKSIPIRLNAAILVFQDTWPIIEISVPEESLEECSYGNEGCVSVLAKKVLKSLRNLSRKESGRYDELIRVLEEHNLFSSSGCFYFRLDDCEWVERYGGRQGKK